MIRVSVSEVKNRLSFYLRLVRGGEQIEILDRNTPVARLIHVSQISSEADETPWIKEVEMLGIVASPRKKGIAPEFLDKKNLIAAQREDKPDVLKALLEERKSGR